MASINSRGLIDVKLNAPISITFMIPSLGTGGAEGMLCRLLSGMDRKRFTAKVISLIDLGSTPIVEKIQALGVPIRFLGMQPGMPNPIFVLKLARWLREDQPDLISTWQYHADLIGGLAARLAGGIPVAWGIRQSDLSPEGNGSLTFLTVRMCAHLSRWLPRKIICCSDASRRVHTALGYAGEKMIMIPNGYDLGTFRPDSAARESIREELQIPENAPVIGLVARFHPQKDHRNFMLAASSLHKDRPEVHFVLCGQEVNWENKALIRWIDEAGIQKRVYLLGRRDDIPKLTAALDIACLSSSYGEGFPNIVSEAMSCEVPCVVTDVGDAALIVGETGIVVPPRDPAALAAALHQMVDLGQEGRKQLGIAARQRITEEFDLPKIVARYENFFQELVYGE
jgi:glycosyltransferase involved in cell wall biosynthesis